MVPWRLAGDGRYYSYLEEEVLLKVCDRVRDIRGCYDMFLQDDDYFLARILTIDGLFLLFLFHSYNSGVDSGDERYELQQKSKESNEHIVNVEVDTRRRLFAQDLMMAENQIPFTVLKEIDMALNSPSGNSILSDDNFSGIIFRSFCVTHSPLELCSLAQAPSHVEHLLDYMYHSIVNNVPLNNNGPQDLETSVHGPIHQVRSMKSKKEEELLLPTGNTGTGPSLGKFPSPIFHFVQKIPWEKFIPLYKQTVTTLETFSKNRTNIYSASKLHGAGFKFHLLQKEEGIWKIDSKGKDIYLPCVTLHTDSEVILRNLVVYEMLMVNSDNFPLTEYVGLMCGLIMNVNDVKVLKRQKIIGGASLKIVAFLISLMTVFLLTSQAYCDAYGCAKANVSLLTYTPFSHNT
ncbi:hypothetical protein L2E82_30136 [Cichorium intybus]|uniref:Uncharacterized protein n=1 Tax=Cichorium intybus TaxID=13427 RepID=A0ACB9CZJ1_CICIN|nr:hypothetical protein L2E82_30136 [Cichorium intybus]